jgi:hypothetical protein
MIACDEGCGDCAVLIKYLTGDPNAVVPNLIGEGEYVDQGIALLQDSQGYEHYSRGDMKHLALKKEARWKNFRKFERKISFGSSQCHLPLLRGVKAWLSRRVHY